MKLLIVTQVFDREHDDLGFFVRWIEEFKKHSEVEVISWNGLGKSRGERLTNFYRITYTLDYGAVFVHMIPEFVIAGWPVWKARNKKVGLWYVHGTVSWRLRLAALMADFVFSASRESCRIQSEKIKVLGHGIDTDFFSPDPMITREEHLLSVGRLSPVKRHDLAIRVAAGEGRLLRIVGTGSERRHLEALAQDIGARVVFVGGLTQAALRDEYRRAHAFVYTSETGSLDKVVLEARATATPVIPSSAYASLSVQDIQKNHSLKSLIPKILAFYA